MAHELEMVPMACGTCGINFYITDDLFSIRDQNDEMIFCPSGHQHRYQLPKAVRQVNDARLLELHQIEQAEARAADKGRKRKGVG